MQNTTIHILCKSTYQKNILCKSVYVTNSKMYRTASTEWIETRAKLVWVWEGVCIPFQTSYFCMHQAKCKWFSLNKHPNSSLRKTLQHISLRNKNS